MQGKAEPPEFNSLIMEKNLKNQEEIIKYIKDRVMPILEPLQLAILNQRPDNIKHFSFNWLQSNGTLSLMQGLSFKEKKSATSKTTKMKFLTTFSRKNGK